MKEEGKPHKPERNLIMRKSTLETIKTALTNYGFENAEVMAELTKELTKGADTKAKNAEIYEAIHDIVMDAMPDEPAPFGEIYDSIKDSLPNGVTRNKVQYGITRLWKDEIVKVDGNPCKYGKA